MVDSLLTLRDVCARLALSRSGLYALIARGEFMPPLRIGRASRWHRHEVEAWLAARPRGTAQGPRPRRDDPAEQAAARADLRAIHERRRLAVRDAASG